MWRGINDDEQEADDSDKGHKGRVWLTFPRGQDPRRSLKLRQRIIAAIRSRFPVSRAIPILPSGALSLAADLRDVQGGYKMTRSAAQR